MWDIEKQIKCHLEEISTQIENVKFSKPFSSGRQ